MAIITQDHSDNQLKRIAIRGLNKWRKQLKRGGELDQMIAQAQQRINEIWKAER